MDTVELFAGIGGFRVATDGHGWRTLWANDICPKACAVYRDRFGGGELREGDFALHKESIPAHDLLTGGFPCQPFSSAGKKAGIRDVRGTLFQSIVDVLTTHRPQAFILENVKRLLTMEKGRHFATILAALADLDYTVEWRLLNAMHFGLPQNRERVILLGTRFTERQDRHPSEELAPIRLAPADDLTNLHALDRAMLFDPRSWPSITAHRARFASWGLADNGRFFAAEPAGFAEASPLVTVGTILEPRVLEAFDFTEATLAWVGANSPVNRFVNGVEILSNQQGGARMGYTIFGVNGVAPTLTSTTSRHYERYKVGERYRRLTNVEYARIQGFADDHCRAGSVYDQYALFGNAVPPAMVKWVMGRLKGEGIARSELTGRASNRSLFDYAG